MSIYNLTKGLEKSLEELLAREVELHVEDGLILPNLRMVEKDAAQETAVPECAFLNEEGRCSIHAFRPGFCRLFPLGRNYAEGRLGYFVLGDACPALNKSKVKIEKWIGIPRIREYEAFLVEWHTLTKGLRFFYADNTENEAIIKAINIQFLQIFYLTPYMEGDFYVQFGERMAKMKALLQQLRVDLPEE